MEETAAPLCDYFAAFRMCKAAALSKQKYNGREKVQEENESIWH